MLDVCSCAFVKLQFAFRTWNKTDMKLTSYNILNNTLHSHTKDIELINFI